MSTLQIDTASLEGIANAIRQKAQKTGTMKPEDMRQILRYMRNDYQAKIVNGTLSWDELCAIIAANNYVVPKYIYKENSTVNSQTVSLPAGTTEISASAFYDCINTISIDVPSSVTTVDRTSFYKVPNINGDRTFLLNKGARMINGYIEGPFVFSNSSKSLLAAVAGFAQGDIIIPEGPDLIEENTFYKNTLITGVEFPEAESGSSFNTPAFESTSGIRKVFIPQTWEIYGDLTAKTGEIGAIYTDATSKPDHWEEGFNMGSPVYYGVSREQYRQI